jgi:hypothetical protein
MAKATPEAPWYIGAHSLDRWLNWKEFQAEKEDDGSHPWGEDMQQAVLRDVYTLCVDNPAFLLHEFMWIRTKAGGRRRFDDWTPAQKKVYVAAMAQYASGKPVRIVILKARQMGISTLCEGLLFWRTAFFRDATSLIVAHEEEAVNNIYGMFRLYYEALPEQIRPMTEKFNQGEIVFDNPKMSDRRDNPGLGSRLVVKTAALGGAGKKVSGKGRSATYQGVHASEAGFWAEPERFWGGVVQGIPDVNHSWVFIESTANGVGNWYHDFWRRAAVGWDMVPLKAGGMTWAQIDKSASRSGYIPSFLSWLEHPEYSKPLPQGVSVKQFVDSYDKDERKLVDIFGATVNQLQWRREAITDKCDGDLHLFHQEYPATPTEAFVSSGRKVFDMGALSIYSDECIERQRFFPADRCDFDVDTHILDTEDRFPWAKRTDPEGPVTLFVPPKPTGKYTIGVDLCYGKPNGDFACAQVLDRETWEQVAIAHARMDPDQMGRLVYALARHYNDALVVVEVDGPGINTLTKLQELDYWHLYRRLGFDGISRKPQPTWGWRMSGKARDQMVSTLKSVIRSREIVIHDLATVREMQEWVLITGSNGRAKEQPSGGPHSYDDRITSLGIAMVGGIMQNGLGGFVTSKAVDNETGANKSPFSDITPTFRGDGVHPTLGEFF